MQRFLTFLLLTFFPVSIAYAGETVTYNNDSGEVFEGYIARPDESDFPGQRPAILIVHQWKGLGDYEKSRADMMADQGYVAFAVDIYGQDIRPETSEAAGEESSKYKDDPDLARKRMTTALDYIHELPNVDTNKIAAIGYCFGDTMALELARSGAEIAAVVSFHGGLASKKPAQEDDINAAIMVHNGEADPHVSKEEIAGFVNEMNSANADWHMISYADAVHAFTEKEAGNDPSTGAAYNEKADKRSWAYTLEFLKMVFGA